jgi:hypothetical protein
MITELIMLSVAVTLFYLATKITKSLEPPKLKDPGRFLAYCLIGCGIGFLGCDLLRMILVGFGPLPDSIGDVVLDQYSVPLLCYKFGSIFYCFGLLSSVVFAGLFFTRWGEGVWRTILIVLFLLSLVLIPLRIPCQRIPIEPYEVLVFARIEYLLGMTKFVPFLLSLILLAFFPGVRFLIHGLKVKGNERKKSILFSFGFLILTGVGLVDGMAPWPALIFLWRILYGVGGGIIYFAFKVKM